MTSTCAGFYQVEHGGHHGALNGAEERSFQREMDANPDQSAATWRTNLPSAYDPLVESPTDLQLYWILGR